MKNTKQRKKHMMPALKQLNRLGGRQMPNKMKQMRPIDALTKPSEQQVYNHAAS